MRKLATLCAVVHRARDLALARNGAWYVGGDFGGMIVEDTGFDFGLTRPFPARNAQVVLDPITALMAPLRRIRSGHFRLRQRLLQQADVETSKPRSRCPDRTRPEPRFSPMSSKLVVARPKR